MNTEIFTSLKGTITLMLNGALRDARESLEKIDAAGCAALADLITSLSLLIGRLTESFAAKESALATVQLSMLELEATQEELLAKEERYRELFSNMNDGVVVYETLDDGQDFVIKDINNASLRIERTDREAVVGRRLTEVFPGAQEFGLLDVLCRVYQKGAPEHLPARFYRDQRISGWRDNFVYRLPTKEVVAVYRDVSEQKASEKALRSALESTERLIDAAPIGLVVVGKDQTIRRVNEVAGKILGAKPRDLVGQGWRQFITGALDSTRRMSAEENVLVDIKGKSIPVLMSVIPVKLKGDEVVYIMAFLDLTERKSLESQLRHAQKMEAVGRLAAGVAHEINTPIQYVGDNTHFLQNAFGELLALVTEYGKMLAARQPGEMTPEVIKEWQEVADQADLGYLTAEIPKAIDQSLEGVERVAKIVQAMKDFSHPGTGEKKAVDVNKAIESTVMVARNEWKYVAELVTDLDPGLPLVPCLQDEFNQVLLNLIINAAHAIGDTLGRGEGTKGTITISTRKQGDWVEIKLKDTGAGIPEEIRTKIFDPFFTTKEVGKGTGQGLAISHAVIVDKHGGTINYETEMGKGTTFIIRLPWRSSGSARIFPDEGVPGGEHSSPTINKLQSS
jgi:PAS domain S-box-containing protein